MPRDIAPTVRLDDQERALLAAISDHHEATLGWGVRLLILDDRREGAKPARVTARARRGATMRRLEITFRVSDGEFEHLRARAAAAEVDVSTYVRALIHAGARSLGIEAPAPEEETPAAAPARPPPGRARTR